jgi:hypothetical protein
LVALVREINLSQRISPLSFALISIPLEIRVLIIIVTLQIGVIDALISVLKVLVIVVEKHIALLVRGVLSGNTTNFV